MKWLEGLEYVSTGLYKNCQECGESFGGDEVPEDDEGYFSWGPCESCGDPLGGTRYTAHGRDRGGDLIHLAVCVNCLFEINGMEVEKCATFG